MFSKGLIKKLTGIKFNRRLIKKLCFYSLVVITSIFVLWGYYLVQQLNDSYDNIISKNTPLITISRGNKNTSSEEAGVDRIQNIYEDLRKRVEHLELLVKDIGIPKKNDTKKYLTTTSTNGVIGQDGVTLVREPGGQIRNGNGMSPNCIEEGNHLASCENCIPQQLTPAPLKTSAPKSEIKKITFELNQSNYHKIEKPLEQYVSEGPLAKEILNSGVIALPFLGSVANSQPVQNQLADFGVVPQQTKPDTKTCFVIETAVRGLTSEQAFIRLKKIFCVNHKTGEVIQLTPIPSNSHANQKLNS